MPKKRKRGPGRGFIVAAGLALFTVAGVVLILLLPAKAKRYVAPPGPVVSDNVKASLEPLRGKVVLLDFWATWCGPCRMEIPGFIDLQQKYRDKGLEIVGVSLDPLTPPQGRPDQVDPFMKKMKINYTIWMVNSMGATTGFDCGEGIPTTYLLDRNLHEVGRYVGVHPESFFEDAIKKLL
jgi:thiol-disulfide isomerase/thioredoxin